MFVRVRKQRAWEAGSWGRKYWRDRETEDYKWLKEQEKTVFVVRGSVSNTHWAQLEKLLVLAFDIINVAPTERPAPSVGVWGSGSLGVVGERFFRGLSLKPWMVPELLRRQRCTTNAHLAKHFEFVNRGLAISRDTCRLGNVKNTSQYVVVSLYHFNQ